MTELDYRTPRDDGHAGPRYVHLRSAHLNLALAAVAAVLSLASLMVVAQGAADEPYTVYRRSDALAQLGVGTALMVLWGCVALAVVVLVAARKLSAAWLLLLIWAALCLFYLSYSPRGYVQDLERFVIPTAAQR